jgi:hypothetical protein
MAGCLLTYGSQSSGGSHRDFVQADVLDRGPDNREAAGLRREHVDLLGALQHIAEETLDSIGRLNMSMHGCRELVKRLLRFVTFSTATTRARITCCW